MPDKTFSENPFDPAELRGIPVNKLKSTNVPTPPDTISAKRITVLAMKTNKRIPPIIKLSIKET